jgi:hypothetical protein
MPCPSPPAAPRTATRWGRRRTILSADISCTSICPSEAATHRVALLSNNGRLAE